MSFGDDILDTSRLCFEGDFDTQMQHILQTVRLTRGEVQDLRCLFDDLEGHLQQLAPGCQVMPFGSVVTGLGIRTSDVDCYVMLPNGMKPNKDTVMIAKRILLCNRKIFNELFAITKCKVPLVKFRHGPTGCYCDVSFQSPAGVRNSELIAHLLQIDKRALPLAILIKYWSKVYKITGTNLLPNYALTVLVIFYLQIKNILPSVYDLQNNVESCMIDHWETAFNETCNHEPDNYESVYNLLGGFFQYYSSFDFEQNVISPFTGRVLKRRVFQLKQIPSEFYLYKHNLSDNVCTELKIDSVLCIQDPFDHSRNCAMAVFPRLMAKIMGHVTFAAKTFHEVNDVRYLKAIFTEDMSAASAPGVVRQKHVFQNKINKNKYNGAQISHGVRNHLRTVHKNKWNVKRKLH